PPAQQVAGALQRLRLRSLPMTWPYSTDVEWSRQHLWSPCSTPVDSLRSMNMGGRIAERLAELNWGQTDLVDRALQFCPDPDKPLTIKTLSAIIKRDNIASQWSEPIALALGVTHSWLVWGVGEKFPDGQD